MIRPWDETSHPPQWRLAAAAAWSMEMRMVKRSPLDNRDTSNVAWARYRRLMKGMALVSLLAVVGALGWLRFTMGDALTIHMRSEERRVGEECVSTCRSRGAPFQ